MQFERPADRRASRATRRHGRIGAERTRLDEDRRAVEILVAILAGGGLVVGGVVARGPAVFLPHCLAAQRMNGRAAGADQSIDLQIVAGLEGADRLLEPIVGHRRRLVPRIEVEGAGLGQHLLDREDLAPGVVCLVADRAVEVEILPRDRGLERLDACADDVAVDIGGAIDLALGPGVVLIVAELRARRIADDVVDALGNAKFLKLQT